MKRLIWLSAVCLAVGLQRGLFAAPAEPKLPVFSETALSPALKDEIRRETPVRGHRLEGCRFERVGEPLMLTNVGDDAEIQADAAARPMDRSKLLVGAYCLAPHERDAAHVKELKDCGVDFLYGIPANDRKTLDLFADHGLGVIATGAVPFWHGLDGSQAGEMAARLPLEQFDKALDSYRPHPAIWAVDVVDEPSALDFPHIAKAVERIRPRVGGALPYVNLYPNYASVVQNTGAQTRNQLGTKTYREHVAAYVREVPLDYISYDFYLYSARGKARKSFLGKFYENFEIVSDAARQSGKSLWFIPQVNSSYGELWPSENMLRFQAYTALAFGAEVINWACWGIMDKRLAKGVPGLTGWWTNNVLTLEGKRTEQYAKLKKVNGELHFFGPAYMRYRNVATHAVGATPVRAGAFSDIRASDGSALVVGEMLPRKGGGKGAIFIVGSDDPFDEANRPYRVNFRADGALLARDPQNVIDCRREPNGSWSIPLRSNSAVLIETF